eukprot:253869-Chlamydomonas_euryale.AAC.2
MRMRRERGLVYAQVPLCCRAFVWGFIDGGILGPSTGLLSTQHVCCLPCRRATGAAAGASRRLALPGRRVGSARGRGVERRGAA